MRAREFLIEYKRDITVQKMGERLLARNKADMTKLDTAEKILEQLETADPTKNKQYTMWIINRYIAGDFFLEDLEVVKRYLEKFIEARNKRLLDVVDIGRYSLGGLKEKINQVFKSDEQQDGMGEALYPVIPGTEVLYNGPMGQFAIMSTLEGSMQHNRQVGEFAEWCTADSRAPRHYQGHADRGPLYVYVDPQGTKYQLHFETDQFKDKFDNEIGLEKEKEIVSLPFVWKNIDWKKSLQSDIEKGFKILPRELLSNPEIKQIAYEYWLNKVKQDGWALDYVIEELITPELCLEAVKQDGWALIHVPRELRTPKLCLIAVKEDGGTLQFVPGEFRTPELCLEAVKSNADALKFVPKELKTPEFYIAAVKQNGASLDYVPEELKTPEVGLTAVQQYGCALDYVPEELKTPEFFINILSKDIDEKIIDCEGQSMQNLIPKEYWDNKEFCSIAIKKLPSSIIWVPHKFTEMHTKENWDKAIEDNSWLNIHMESSCPKHIQELYPRDPYAFY